MGANFTFGFKAAGTVATLPEMGAPYGLTAEGVPLARARRPDGVVVVDPRRARWRATSTWPARGARAAVRARRRGRTSGHGRGKGLGFPTANLQTWPRLLLPGQGIYAGVAELQGRRYRTAIDVGTNPTFGVEPLHVEAFLLDFEGDELHGEPLAIEFWERLRDEIRYDSIDELVAAIADDVDRTRAIVPDDQLGR